MRAAFVSEPSAADPVAAIEVGELDLPEIPDGWVRVDVRAGFTASLDLTRLFAREITVRGSTMGSLEEFRALVGYVAEHRLRPAVDSTVDLADIHTQAARMLAGGAFGKLCVRVA